MDVTEPPRRDRRVREGGLYRCCIDSVNDRDARDSEGDVMTCKHCGEALRFRLGAWEWDYSDHDKRG